MLLGETEKKVTALIKMQIAQVEEMVTAKKARLENVKSALPCNESKGT